MIARARPGGWRLFRRLILRDWQLMGARPGEWLLPIIFFLLVTLLLPFAIGPDRELLQRLAPGILWVGALLASLLPVSTLFAQDAADGTLDQLAVRGISGELLGAARMLALWAGFTLPLLVALPVAALLLDVGPAALGPVALALLAGGLGLAALAVIAAALTAGARGGGALAALIVVPLATPMLLFGSRPHEPGALLLTLAAALLLAAIGPFAAGGALRAAQS